MPPKNRFAEMLPELTAIRHDFHENPELLFDVHRTAAKVAEFCRAIGCDEVVEGIGRTGVIAVIKGKTDTKGRVIGCAPIWMRCRSMSRPGWVMPRTLRERCMPAALAGIRPC